jgi:hypothetical protein
MTGGDDFLWYLFAGFIGSGIVCCWGGDMMFLNNRKLMGNKMIIWTALMLSGAIFSGCMGGAYGRLNGDPDTTRAFSQNQMIPGYHYYYVGRASIPYAIVGIKDEYVFISKFWKPISPGSSEFGKIVGRVYGSGSSSPKGAKIVGPDGDLVGYWFSTATRATIEFKPDKRVIVYSPYSPGSRSSFLH